MAITVYISVGNSDDKLSQDDWAAFQHRFMAEVTSAANETHGMWYSAPDARCQNMCICAVLADYAVLPLRKALTDAAATYGQDSIAWAEAPVTEFIGPEPEAAVTP